MANRIGLDIGTYSIKLIQLRRKGQESVVESAFEVVNPVGQVLATDKNQRDQLVSSIESIFSENKIKTNGITLGVPENQVVTKIVTMPLLSDAELASAITWQVEQQIPIALEELQYEYAVLRRSDRQEEEQTMDILLVGGKRQFMQDFADQSLDAGLDVDMMESESLAITRLVADQLVGETAAVINCGASFTSMMHIHQGQLKGVITAPLAGALMTRALERGLGLSLQQAEEYKRSYGLSPQQLEGRVQNSLQPVVQALIIELQKGLRFFSSQEKAEAIAKVYVIGGSSAMVDIIPALSAGLNREVVPLNLNTIPGITLNEGVALDGRYATALGLALKEEE